MISGDILRVTEKECTLCLTAKICIVQDCMAISAAMFIVLVAVC